MKSLLTSLLLTVISCISLRGQSFNETMQDINNFKVFKTLEEALNKPDEVVRLDLSDSKIDETALEESLPKFNKLRELKLSNTFISKIPESIGYLHNLQVLEIQHLKEQNFNLTEIPASIQELKEMVYINLIGNPDLEWSQMLTYLSRLPKLVNIALMNNSFEKLPAEITKLSSLEMIWLGQNPDLDLRDTFLKLSKLDNLSQMGLGGNGHTQLPTEISLLKNISNLWLSGNNWENLEGIQHLPNLTQLSLHNCNLKTFLTKISECQNLEYLSLVDNPQLDFGQVLSQLPVSTKILNLSNNNIAHLPINLLKKSTLTKLVLRNNQISESDLAKYKLSSI